MSEKNANSRHEKTTSTDWSAVHRRMEHARAAIERGATPSDEEKKVILKTRAKILAQDPDEKKTFEDQIEVVQFLLGHENYCIETSYVREVYPMKELTRLPGTPPFVLGIINVRGQILSILDLKRFFKLPEREATDHSKVIIACNEAMEFGILADAVLDVRSVPLKEIQPLLPTLAGVSAEYLRGVTKERIVVLDAEKILSDKRLTVHQEAGA